MDVILMSVVTVFAIVMLGMVAVSKIRHYRWFCETMDWHVPNSATEEGFYLVSKAGRAVPIAWESHCAVCGRRILQDSQGDWFSASRQE